MADLRAASERLGSDPLGLVTRRRGGGPSVRSRVLAALAEGPGLAGEVGIRAGTAPQETSGALDAFYREGMVARDGERGSYVWRLVDGGQAP